LTRVKEASELFHEKIERKENNKKVEKVKK